MIEHEVKNFDNYSKEIYNQSCAIDFLNNHPTYSMETASLALRLCPDIFVQNTLLTAIRHLLPPNTIMASCGRIGGAKNNMRHLRGNANPAGKTIPYARTGTDVELLAVKLIEPLNKALVEQRHQRFQKKDGSAVRMP